VELPLVLLSAPGPGPGGGARSVTGATSAAGARCRGGEGCTAWEGRGTSGGRGRGGGGGGRVKHLVHHGAQVVGHEGALRATLGEKAGYHHRRHESDGEGGRHPQALVSAQGGLRKDLASSLLQLLVCTLVPLDVQFRHG